MARGGHQPKRTRGPFSRASRSSRAQPKRARVCNGVISSASHEPHQPNRLDAAEVEHGEERQEAEGRDEADHPEERRHVYVLLVGHADAQQHH
eukprot:6490166-Prymnesium_polylepis.1